MAKILSVTELRARAGSILRRVPEKREPVDVSYRGEVIARIVPMVPKAEVAEQPNAVWTDIDWLASEIGRHWEPEDKSAAEIVSEERR